MPLTGLSNQWKSFDGLINRFADAFRKLTDDPNHKYNLIIALLEQLNDSTESWIYVGTSHSSMNFSTRDVISDRDLTKPFAFVDVVQNPGKKNEYNYFVKTRVIVELRPSPQWQTVIYSDTVEVVQILLNAHASADVPIRRTNG